jgi:hypothetical protein
MKDKAQSKQTEKGNLEKKNMQRRKLPIFPKRVRHCTHKTQSMSFKFFSGKKRMLRNYTYYRWKKKPE